jgi:hypothetical protein
LVGIVFQFGVIGVEVNVSVIENKNPLFRQWHETGLSYHYQTWCLGSMD